MIKRAMIDLDDAAAQAAHLDKLGLWQSTQIDPKNNRRKTPTK